MALGLSKDMMMGNDLVFACSKKAKVGNARLTGLGLELSGLVTDGKRKIVRSLSDTKPNSSLPKPAD